LETENSEDQQQRKQDKEFPFEKEVNKTIRKHLNRTISKRRQHDQFHAWFEKNRHIDHKNTKNGKTS
jgi:hypothetical protein